MQRLLVSVRGAREALAAARGGAQIADVEYPASALGTPYPLNIAAVRVALNRAGRRRVLVSTNVGEIPYHRANACQAALGVAAAGADLIKFGLGELPLKAASYQGREIVRSVRKWYPRKRLYPAVFVDDDMQRYFDALGESLQLANQIDADGVLLDTFEKATGKGLLDFVTAEQIGVWTKKMHRAGKEAWVAGSVTRDELPPLWRVGVDVVCVRGAACKPGKGGGRFGAVDEDLVADLLQTL